jgi:pyruvate/2-oxoglutarate dehydrogenase complex dihydrolipoamide acyltransferase (E2) component
MDVAFPTMSQADPLAEGVVATWFVRDGEHVVAGQLLAEVQVDKVSTEIPAPVAGTIHLHAPEEAVVRQGTVIASVD